MASAFDPWLPRNATAAAAERLPVRVAVSDWAAKWFAHGGASVASMEAVVANVPIGGIAMAIDDGPIVIADDEALTATGKLMFGDPADTPTAADRAAVDVAAEQALADWRQRAVQLLGLPRDAAWRPRTIETWPAGFRFRIELGKASLTLHVPDQLLVATVKSRLRPDPARSPLGTLAAGLAPHSVALSALLGECRLSTRDLAALGPGDVVILDRRLTHPATLVIDRTPQHAHCRIAAADHHLDLTLA